MANHFTPSCMLGCHPKLSLLTCLVRQNGPPFHPPCMLGCHPQLSLLTCLVRRNGPPFHPPCMLVCDIPFVDPSDFNARILRGLRVRKGFPLFRTIICARIIPGGKSQNPISVHRRTNDGKATMSTTPTITITPTVTTDTCRLSRKSGNPEIGNWSLLASF